MAKSYAQLYRCSSALQASRESRKHAARDLTGIMAGIISLVLAAGYVLSLYIH